MVWSVSSAPCVWWVITAGEWGSRCEGLAEKSWELLLWALCPSGPHSNLPRSTGICASPVGSLTSLPTRSRDINCGQSPEGPPSGQTGPWEKSAVLLLTSITSTPWSTLKASSAGEKMMHCLGRPMTPDTLTSCQSQLKPETWKKRQDQTVKNSPERTNFVSSQWKVCRYFFLSKIEWHIIGIL